ncbi:MAG TPA: UDP-N-acetylmuramoyl-tripeptide--D-alanyl-D-alanine ligase [Actinomycetota bacterium]
MIPLTLQEVAEAAGGVLRDADGTAVSTGMGTDSRTIRPGDLFVALPGSQTDGRRFAAAAVAAGAVAAVVQTQTERGGAGEPGTPEFHGVPRVEVSDPLRALMALAAAVRGRSRARVVGITGSTGKTTTKDLLHAALSTRLRTRANQGSFNTEVGLPLTLARLEPDTEALVVEMGARGPGHIAELAALAHPEVGVVLNVGVAHIGMFGSREAIAAAKGELVEALPASGTAVLNADDPLVAAMAGRTAARVLRFGAAAADVGAEAVTLDDAGCAHLKLRTPAGSVALTLPAPGEHLVSDALAAAAAAHVLGLDPDQIAAGLAAARLSPGRMQVGRRADGLTVINDAYNANPASLAAALKVLAAARHKEGGRRVAVLGEMAELGDHAEAEHNQAGRLATRLGIDRLIGVGPAGQWIVTAARLEGMSPEEALVVPNVTEALALLTPWLTPADVVLVKASRVVALDRLAEQLLSGEGDGNGDDWRVPA